MIKHRSSIAAIVLAAGVMGIPAWAAGHGGGGMGHGAGGMGHGAGGMSHSAGGTDHGATVSAAAHSAHTGGEKVGPAVRSVARSNSQGPLHASANAISHVQNSPGKANSNSVLGTGATSSTATTAKTHPSHGRSTAKSKPAKTGASRTHMH